MSDWLSRVARLNERPQPVHDIVNQVRHEARSTLIEVRCCCEPAKVLGYVRVSGFTHLEVGKPVTFMLRTSWHDPIDPPVEQVRLTYAEWGRDQVVVQPLGTEGNETRYQMASEVGLAFKSGDHPLETLRRIVGWVDA